MSNGDDRDYFYSRAERELELARRADHPAACKAHYTLAGYYLDRVYGGEEPHRPPMQIVPRIG